MTNNVDVDMEVVEVHILKSDNRKPAANNLPTLMKMRIT
jgi:hypothetical protein